MGIWSPVPTRTRAQEAGPGPCSRSCLFSVSLASSCLGFHENSAFPLHPPPLRQKQRLSPGSREMGRAGRLRLGGSQRGLCSGGASPCFNALSWRPLHLPMPGRCPGGRSGAKPPTCHRPCRERGRLKKKKSSVDLNFTHTSKRTSVSQPTVESWKISCFILLIWIMEPCVQET